MIHFNTFTTLIKLFTLKYKHKSKQQKNPTIISTETVTTSNRSIEEIRNKITTIRTQQNSGYFLKVFCHV